MNFFLDENFPKSAAKILEEQGHTVHDVRCTKDEGMSDLAIFKLAQIKQALFLTTDKDFFHTIPHLFEHHHGVIIIALRKPNRKTITDKLLYALKHFDLSTFKSKTLLLRDHTFSIIDANRE